MKINIFYDRINFRIRNRRKVINLIEKVIIEENIPLDDLNFVLTDDESILGINNEFLKHNYFTDVIAFRYVENARINGEVYISMDRVRENAHNYKVSLKSEILRVMVHGTLHICGYDDLTEIERGIMREKEDYWIYKYNVV